MLEELVRAVTGRDPVGWTGLSGPTRAGLGQRELGRAVAGLGRHCWTGALDSDRVVPALAWGGVDPAVSNCLDSMLGLPTVLEEESTLDG
ncbi:hypothetical protein CDL15_Pgr017059 [Punica granatum]|uniref:Uncharacterized protein n=1 Tax=Punica granatum TaxID=22663 RepID=A0A218WYR5_PUNGR|nr:hypothetical protein CDL15_Pgr017059 [Punica granatum]